MLLLVVATCVGIAPAQAQKKRTVPPKKHATAAKTPLKKAPAPIHKKTEPVAKPAPVIAKAGTIAPNSIDTFKLQVSPLVKFFESSLNFLSDPRNGVNEKQVIISQSYLKWCWDEKVQVEDDLDENRLVTLNKDMTAYLSDVSFFFRSARFSYQVQDLAVETGQDGHTYFRVTANRNLRGVTINGDSVNSNKVRYIEINFDSVKQQMKIVSVYTTKLNEKDDMRNWWNALSHDWKVILAKDMALEGTMPLAQVDNFNDSVAMVGGKTTHIMGSEFYKLLGQIIHSQGADLNRNRSIASLEPLNKLSNLRELNISGTPVSDLMPLRNLNKLEILDISGTNVISLEPLRYCLRISQLTMKGAPVADLSVVSTFKNLTTLDISGTRVTSLEPVGELTNMKDLRLSRTKIRDLAPVAGLVNLEFLNISSTGVDNLAPLKDMSNLHILLCDSTGIKSLGPLDNLSSLERLYCNDSPLTQAEALNFIKKHPGASLVYASRALSGWWKGMAADWQNIFGLFMKLNNPPSTEQLHKLVLLDSINIAGRMSITSLEPLRKIILLRSLNCQSTGISSLAPLSDLGELQVINTSNTKVADLQPLSGLANLETLNIDNTAVAELGPLYGLARLRFLFADNSSVKRDEANKFAVKNPACLLVFQTFENTEWWKNLDQTWKEVFLQQAGLKGNPDKIELQQIAGLTRIDISEKFQIADLNPLQHLSRLTELQFSGTSVSRLDPVSRMPQLQILRFPKNPVVDLSPVMGMPNLMELDFSNTLVEDLLPLQNMMHLEVLKFNGTQIKNLKYLQKLVNLKVIEFYNSRVGNVDVLDGMSRLESVKMFNTKVSQKRVDKLKMMHPKCEIIFY